MARSRWNSGSLSSHTNSTIASVNPWRGRNDCWRTPSGDSWRTAGLGKKAAACSQCRASDRIETRTVSARSSPPGRREPDRPSRSRLLGRQERSFVPTPTGTRHPKVSGSENALQREPGREDAAGSVRECSFRMRSLGDLRSELRVAVSRGLKDAI